MFDHSWRTGEKLNILLLYLRTKREKVGSSTKKRSKYTKNSVTLNDIQQNTLFYPFLETIQIIFKVIFSAHLDFSEDSADDSWDVTSEHPDQHLIEVTRNTQADLWQADKPAGKPSSSLSLSAAPHSHLWCTQLVSAKD